MGQSTILAVGTTPLTSSDVPVAANTAVTLGLFVASGNIPHGVAFDVYIDTPGADISEIVLTRDEPTTVITGPCTARVTRRAASSAVGVFLET